MPDGLLEFISPRARDAQFFIENLRDPARACHATAMRQLSNNQLDSSTKRVNRPLNESYRFAYIVVADPLNLAPSTSTKFSNLLP